jgi:predicted enzyme related to lactoylglutathione lyase
MGSAARDAYRTEVEMSTPDVSSETATASAPPKPGEVRIEVVTLPVSDVDRTKAFYEGLGWRLDIDFEPRPGVRAVQMTPPGSPCSIQFGVGLTTAEPGSAQGTFLVVPDIGAAREQLTEGGAEVSEISGEGNYASRASFSDPDGNGWVLQEVTERLPGR